MKKLSIHLLVGLFCAVSPVLAAAANKSKASYACNCKDGCKCNSISKETDKYKCGFRDERMHLLTIEEDTAVLCRCGIEWTCERSKDDSNKCGCGKPVRRVSIKSKYVSGCGADCNCGTTSDTPGKCSCGKDLKQYNRTDQPQ